jgi:hypothetical protein
MSQERGESFYNPYLKGIVDELNEKVSCWGDVE